MRRRPLLLSLALIVSACGGKPAPEPAPPQPAAAAAPAAPAGGATTPEEAAAIALRRGSMEQRLTVVRATEHALLAATEYLGMASALLPNLDAMRVEGETEFSKATADLRALGVAHKLPVDGLPETPTAVMLRAREVAATIPAADARALALEVGGIGDRLKHAFEAEGESEPPAEPKAIKVTRITDDRVEVLTQTSDSEEPFPVVVVRIDGRWWVDYGATLDRTVAQLETATNAAEAETAEAGDDALGPIGVPECDDYIAKMTACIDNPKFPAEARDGTRQALTEVVKQWRALPPEAKANIGPACKAGMDAAAKSLTQLGCTF